MENRRKMTTPTTGQGCVPRPTQGSGCVQDLPDCDVCLALHGRLGAQEIKCEEKPESYHTFTLTESQLTRLKNDLRESDQDPPGIQEFKKRALDHVPRGSFSRQVRVHYIRAGPGCGKSYVIRQLADENDLVLAPFSKLKTDYEKIKGTNGSSYDLPFKTQHRAMETKGYQRIFFDEFTSFSYEFSACVVFLNAAEEVYLVGDDRQTKIREHDEGMYIGNHLLSHMSTHPLLVNIRSPPDTVAILNKRFGNEMKATKEENKEGLSIKYVSRADDEADKPALRMCFTHAASRSVTQHEGNTVRSNQGGTSKDVKLDGNTPEETSLQTVALLRHTDTLTIVTDDSPTANKFKPVVEQGASWERDYHAYLKFPEVENKPALESDPMISRVISMMDSDNLSSGSGSEGEGAKKRPLARPEEETGRTLVRGGGELYRGK